MLLWWLLIRQRPAFLFLPLASSGSFFSVSQPVYSFQPMLELGEQVPLRGKEEVEEHCLESEDWKGDLGSRGGKSYWLEGDLSSSDGRRGRESSPPVPASSPKRASSAPAEAAALSCS